MPLADSTWTNPADIQRRFRNPRNALSAIEDSAATANISVNETVPHPVLPPDIPDPRLPNIITPHIGDLPGIQT